MSITEKKIWGMKVGLSNSILLQPLFKKVQ